jgi:hypothetical protein
MGDYYDFAFQEVNGYLKSGFIYKNKKTNWNEVFVEFTDKQKDLANELQGKVFDLEDERQTMIKGWVNAN